MLDQAPNRWYPTGLLALRNASHDHCGDIDADDEADMLEPAPPAAPACTPNVS
ncbi:MAG: hypothetical protein RKP20_04935 [Candidatus Competibacter sp.]|nr:hypothetical protein [Candidatus Competibacter sp.]